MKKLEVFVFTVILSFTASMVNAQQSIVGTWNTGQENTQIEILPNEESWIGKIKSSDNTKASIGKIIVKDLKKEGDTWTGKLFAAKRKKWVDVVFKPNETKMDLIISAGFSKKEIEWERVN